MEHSDRFSNTIFFEMIEIIQKGRASTWKHVNLQGIYDFISPEKSNLYFFKIEEI